MTVEGFIRKPPPTGTQFMELLAHQVAQLIAEGEGIIPSEDEAKVQSEEFEEEGFKSLVCEEDFTKVFYHPNMIEDAVTTSTLTTATVSTG